MKKVIISISVFVMTIGMPSCSADFLDLAPENTLNTSNFYQTEDHFTQAVNGVYEAARQLSGKPGFLMGEMRSDNTHYQRNEVDRGQRRAEEIADFTDESTNMHTNNYYNNCFSGISKANTVLSRIDGKEFSDSFMNKTIGQVKFLRAYFYFQLVRYYGGVSLHLSEVTNTEDAFLPRSSEEEVYAQIILDLEDAINKLDLPVFPQDGHLTKGSARMMLAEVLMTKPTRDYPGAEQQLKELMKMGYKLVNNYADVFDTNNKNNTESIFEIQHQAGDQGQESGWLYWFMPITQEGKVITGVDASNNSVDGGWNMPTEEMVQSYEPGDLRLNPSVAVAVGEFENGYFAPKEVLNVGDPKIKEYSSYFYFVNKYRHEHSKINNTDDNWPVYRYADALLLMAECLAYQNRATEALPYVNQVRERAGLPALATVSLETIENERRHELAFENHRWHDLVRTGFAIDVMNEHGKRMKKIYPYLEDRTYQVNQDKLIFPLPYLQLQINSSLKQNNGY